MYKVKIISYFSAAHFLRGYKGKCEALHGHNWKVEVAAVSQELDDKGMVMDFSDLKKITAITLEELDHKYLNDLPYFKEKNPSSEQIARYLFDKLEEAIGTRFYRLEKVKVWETENSCAEYSV